jgi:hypothetical protein
VRGAGHQWVTPEILASQEAEIRKIAVGNQPQVNSLRDLILKSPSQKKKIGRLAQAVEAECKHEELSSNPSTSEKKKL